MRRYLTFLFLSALLIEAKGQDAHFSQFYSNPLYLSPSFAGSSEGSRVILNYRDQWPKIPGTYVTYSFSGDHYFKNLRSGMGLILLADQAGGGKLTTINLGYLYSFRIPVTRRFSIQPGLSAYYYDRRTNFSSLNFADQYFDGEIVGSTSEVLSASKVQHVDFAASCLAFTNNYWGGLTVDHLMKVSSVINADSRYASVRFSLFGGMKYTIKRRVRSRNYDVVYATFSYIQQSQIKQLDLGAYYVKSPMMFGLWYRGIPFGNKYSTSDALIYFIGVKTKNFTISYSYDMTIGPLISKTGGSHEIAIIYNIAQTIRPVKRKYAQIPCPEL